MPQRAYSGPEFNQYVAPTPIPQMETGPSGDAVIGAAFSMENDVVAAVDLMSRPIYEPDPTWKPVEWLKANNYWDEYRDNFIGARSQAEAEGIAQRIKEEEENRNILQQAGWGGTAAAVAAGILSPTMFMPFVGGGRGAVAFGRSAALGLAAGAAQEIPLQVAQETRTAGETAFALSASTILSGILGGVAANVSREQFEELASGLSRDMASLTVKTPIPQAAGAQASRAASPGKLADAMGGVTATKFMSPVIRTIEQDTSPQARWMMTQLADGGLSFEKNAGGVPTTPFGTAENLIKVWNGGYAKAVRAIDENYLSFVYDGNVPGLLPNIRSVARGALGSGEKSKAAFREAIAIAMRNNDESVNQYVASAAKAIRKEVYDPLLQEAQKLGVIAKDLEEVIGDPSYLFRDYNRRAIESNYAEFIDILSKNFETKLNEDFAKKASNFKAAKEKDEDLIRSISMSDEEVAAARDEYNVQLAELEAGANAEHLNALEDSISNLRSMARNLKGQSLVEETQRKQMLRDAKEMEQSGGEGLQKLKANRSELQRRLRNLNKAQVVLREKAAAKLEKVERADDLSFATLKRATMAAQKFLAKMDGLSDEAFDKFASELKTTFAKTAQVYDKGEERLAKAAMDETDPEVGKVLGLEALQNDRADRLSAIAQTLEETENLDRVAVRELVEDGLNETIARAQRIVERRAVRNERLRVAAKKLSPEDIATRVSEIRSSRAAKEAVSVEKIQASGADYVDLTNGTADFARTAADSAKEVARKIMGVHLRLPAFEVMQGERGAELARVLDIPSAAIEKFLENDVEKLTRTYLKTMGPDVEMARKFGTVNAQEQFDELIREQEQAMLGIKKDVEDDWKAKNKGKEITPKVQAKLDAKSEKLGRETADKYKAMRRDLSAVIGRLRHTWGLPADPDGIAYRMGRVAMNLNVLRMMGGVAVSSIPDIARPIMKYGLMSTFKNGFVPLILNFKQFKMAADEVRLAGGALDVLIHSRSQALFDIMDDLGRGSKFERGLEYATNKMGIVALFDYWTSGMKQFSGAIANVELLHSIQSVVEGTGNVMKATKFLAGAGIDGERARDIWQEVLQGGGEKVNGTWMPNTESWKNADNVRAFRSALIREVDNSIVTPGVEKPLWMDASLGGRLISQFKSFAMASTSRTLLAGLQQRDMAFMTGVMQSLALGAFSYYTWAVLAGGKNYTEMMNADAGKWADEAIDRSGLLGILSEVQNIAQRIPATQGISSFGGQRQTRRGGDSLIEAMLGPSFDLGVDVAKVLSELDSPTQSTLGTMVNMSALNNHMLLRRGIDSIEKALSSALNLPETRQ
jgi:hypothetical protein